jgi:methyltransferase (TIGR00027 family)
MKEDQSSDTAMGASVVRAVHQLLDEKPPILEDAISPLLIGDRGISDIMENAEVHRALSARALRSHIVLRSRYAEDRLHHAVESGIDQFVSLGTGYDTFSFRQPNWSHRMKIVEIDHPATQRAKLDAFERVQLPIPENVTFLSLDLERQYLASVIAASKLNASVPTFVACLGVLAYLRPETVHTVFKSVAALPQGSKFVFTFASRQVESLQKAPSVATRTKTRAARVLQDDQFPRSSS